MKILIVSYAAGFLLMGGLSSQAVIVDLTSGSLGTSGIISGGIFESGTLDTSAGSGTYNSFFRLKNSPIESGFNTSGAAMPDVLGGSSREVQLAELNTVTLGGSDYYRFALDLAEPNGSNSKVSLTDLRIFVRDTVVSNATSTAELFLGSPLYAFGADDRVDLDYSLVGGGSGKSDMFFYMPASLFSAFQSDDYFYLYSQFGNRAGGQSADGSFEEWAIAPTNGLTVNQVSNAPIPEPTTAAFGAPIPEPTTALFGAALVGVLGLARRRP